MLRFTEHETRLLSLAIPSLGLPALESPSDRDLNIRAFEIDYPDEVTRRSDKNLEAYMKILGALPSTYEERLKMIHIPEGAVQ